MSVLDNFVEEMLEQTIPKGSLIEQMLRALDSEKPPRFKIPIEKYTFKTGQHGLMYDYQAKTVSIVYVVADGMYPDITVSFLTFRALLEGISICIRQQKW